MLSADFLDLGKEMEMVNAKADLIHLDVMDGVFVPNISFGVPVVEAIARCARKPMDVHLMITDPAKYAERFASAGAAMISFHLEAVPEPVELLRKIRSLGVKAGLAINPDIPVERLFPFLEEVDFVLIMSVFAGFGGQSFIEASHGRIAAVRDEIERRSLDVAIEVDGGISSRNIAALEKDGASMFVAGSSVFKAEDPAAEIDFMRSVR